jgi:DeoR/GlpR family transcriptional regulator of sugar metabolism
MVDLQFYYIDEASGQKIKIDNNLNLGSLFKGTESKIPIAIYNNGDEAAISPQAKIFEFFQSGKDFSESVEWKKLSLSKIAVDKAFIGMDGFSEKLGFTCGDFIRAEVGKEMSKRAEKTIVLADSSKFDNIGVTPVVELNVTHECCRARSSPPG